MITSQTFETQLADKQSVIIPQEVALLFYNAGHKRVKAKAIFEEKNIAFYAALKREKTGIFRIYFSKAKQKELEIFPNDYFKIILSEDQSKYGVEPCEEFEAVMLSDYEAYEIFESLTPGKKRSIIYAIGRYKSSQTRIDKTLLFINNLRRGIFDPRLWLKGN
ncbi:YdeI/OmpD-associated family protein [Winogradskyella jejuensis]|uniref:Bacteriocin-protection, YdeI or OmpD-Associated n=1 Tax=Winogradskyella jejuensis TaxID=1089305 RepID=A0A1M5SQX3_9FLAO|nr:YdeI/OmpD-associated family protein [Winogradskyella jejuensis]SHH40817.1 Bacteriocin-protection, YdeI or OmpD-Associated [Winogradskyella jejuensis]